MTDNPIVVECHDEFVDPVVRVFVAGIFIGDFPVGTYYQIRDYLNLPEIVCPTNGN